jgi:hypothetical protein
MSESTRQSDEDDMDGSSLADRTAGLERSFIVAQMIDDGHGHFQRPVQLSRLSLEFSPPSRIGIHTSQPC